MYQPKHLINVHTHHYKSRDFEDHLAEWTREGTTATCIACVGREWEEAGYNQFRNADLAPWLRRYPDRVIGMAFMETHGVVDDGDEVQRWHDQGFRGLKIICPEAPYFDARYHSIYARAEKLRMPILFHCGMVGGKPGAPLHARSISEYMRPYCLENVARRFPALPIIGAHLGKPHLHEAFAVMGFANVWFDFSGASAARSWQEEIINAMMPRPGVDMGDPDQNPALRHFRKLCFGTDNPPVAKWRPASEYIMDTLRVPPALREDFYWRNAARAFGLTALLAEDNARP